MVVSFDGDEWEMKGSLTRNVCLSTSYRTGNTEQVQVNSCDLLKQKNLLEMTFADARDDPER